ncbi:hypothetical protein Bhyg_11350 [Pseudolycoriella hygida]|uniref:Uncharacterized protein n=1 Tax=Pseudolycoriella hygida TaxID=35572 RepID=A0A9Q0S076_9DIPT|nr:hypothetical protein Bhyg_11350 [Pseudolycoriella hygida]
MKTVFLLIICLVIQEKTVNSQTLQQQLKNAQTQTDQLHVRMTSVLVKFRMEMSKILTGIVSESLSHILKALEASQPKVQNAGDEIDIESERIGKQISRCSAQADNDIEAAIKQFFIVHNPIHENSFGLLNIVLEQMVEWSISSDPKEMVDHIQEMIEAKTKEFEMTSVPALEDEFRKFKNILYLVPSSVSRCTSEAINN